MTTTQDFSSTYCRLDLNHWRAGSGQPLLNQTILGAIPALIPEPKEQRAIAYVLGTLDDKIELNRRMNETLDATARAIFQSWFVDFCPVHAKAEGRDPGLPKDIAALFPDRFEDSELGEIPAGWGVGSLENIAWVVVYTSDAIWSALTAGAVGGK